MRTSENINDILLLGRVNYFSRVISYIPYGEIFMEQQSGAWQSPYLFNAKELDSETGLYYYGARYLDPTSAVWLSVDPLWEKYVGMSPYNYCMGNPMKLIDPDGRGCNGGVGIANNTGEDLIFGGVSGSDDGGAHEINYSAQFLTLKDGQRLVPYKDGDTWKAKIMEGDKEIDDVYAYDVDYLQLQKGQTLTDSDGHRYSTDESDKEAVTPVSSWTETETQDSDHTKHGDLKIRRAGNSDYPPGTIIFRKHYDDNGNQDGIECDTDNGYWIPFKGRANYYVPCIYPEKRVIPHNK